MESSRAIRLVAGLLVLLVLVDSSLGFGCNEELCNRYGCIRLYEHRHHRGRHSCHYPRRERCTNLEDNDWGPSSMKIRGGCVILHSERDCRGDRMRMDVGNSYENDFNGGQFDDRTQSISSCRNQDQDQYQDRDQDRD